MLRVVLTPRRRKVIHICSIRFGRDWFTPSSNQNPASNHFPKVCTYLISQIVKMTPCDCAYEPECTSEIWARTCTTLQHCTRCCLLHFIEIALTFSENRAAKGKNAICFAMQNSREKKQFDVMGFPHTQEKSLHKKNLNIFMQAISTVAQYTSLSVSVETISWAFNWNETFTRIHFSLQMLLLLLPLPKCCCNRI